MAVWQSLLYNRCPVPVSARRDVPSWVSAAVPAPQICAALPAQPLPGGHQRPSSLAGNLLTPPQQPSQPQLLLLVSPLLYPTGHLAALPFMAVLSPGQSRGTPNTLGITSNPINVSALPEQARTARFKAQPAPLAAAEAGADAQPESVSAAHTASQLHGPRAAASLGTHAGWGQATFPTVTWGFSRLSRFAAAFAA